MPVEDAELRSRVELWAALEIEPPKITNLVHVLAEATKDPYAIAPDIRRVVKAADKAPCFGPGKCPQVKVAYVIQHVVVLTCYATDDEELVLVQDRGVASPAFGNRTGNLRLSPVRRFEIEDDEVGEVRAVLVLATKDQQLVALV